MLMISTQILTAHQCYLFGRPVHGHWVPYPSSSIPINILSAHVLLLFDSFTYRPSFMCDWYSYRAAIYCPFVLVALSGPAHGVLMHHIFRISFAFRERMKVPNNDKKMLDVHIGAHTFEIIHLLTDQNLILQVCL
ncbi:hypothetical protein B0H13DRAFT_2352101 [Mycena leptocephala]|nr:hypothetical protein B0H13DRAFT_2352101 [Mycena leptocephala]